MANIIFIFNNEKKVDTVNISSGLDTKTKPGWRQVIKEKAPRHQRGSSSDRREQWMGRHGVGAWERQSVRTERHLTWAWNRERGRQGGKAEIFDGDW